MEKGKVEQAIYLLESLDFKDKLFVYSRVFSMGRFSSDDSNEKLVLLSLVALVTHKMKEKDPSMNALKVLLKITGQPADNSVYYQFLEGLATVVEDMSYECKKFDPCGCKDSKEIIAKIKEILSCWLPF